MNTLRCLCVAEFALAFLVNLLAGVAVTKAQFADKSVDLEAMPKAPPGFEVSLFAREPLVRQPCSMAFDDRGRLFVGMGPQDRTPEPDPPGDSVVIILDTDGDGQADRTQEFAKGFNAIQGLAWHGRDLWIANAPDLTMVRDLNGDDEADEYVRVYTDLGNLEHGLHGLNWAPDGKLYMSKGNSKGLNQPGRYAPKAFRDLWGLQAPADVPDIPAAVTSGQNDYRRAYHDPADDWGLDGGVLRCDDGGSNLEIVARGFRNPWDITFDSGFNWIGTDNDQTTGDRVLMPFYGAHFGWNHPWSSHWSTEPHAPTAPVSGPLFEGSGTGTIFCQSPQFPPEYRGVFFVNDWLLKTTYVWRPQWDGAMLRPDGGDFTPFIEAGSSLFRPTDLEFGPDGALWILGWSSGYGAEWKDGQLTNEGRIYRVSWRESPPAAAPQHTTPLEDVSVDMLLVEFDSPLPVRRINAQDELVRRGNAVEGDLLARLVNGRLTENQETWTVWSLGRMPVAVLLSDFLLSTLQEESSASLNLRIQAARILAHRAKQDGRIEPLAKMMRALLGHPEPRLRFAAIQAVHETRQSAVVPELLEQLQRETDPSVFYAGWQALRALSTTPELRHWRSDSRSAVRRAAFLALAESAALTESEVRTLNENETDIDVRNMADLWLTKAAGGSKPEIRGPSLQVVSAAEHTTRLRNTVAAVRNLKVKNGAAYPILASSFAEGAASYVDRSYRLSEVPPELQGADLIQTANNDDDSAGEQWLSMDAIVPVRVWIGIDARQKVIPSWVRKSFRQTSLTAAIDEGARFRFYEQSFGAGQIELGGNTDDGQSGGKGSYIIAIAPLPPARPSMKATLDASLALVERADRDRGELLFRRSQGAGCGKCHSVDQTKNSFGPNLSGIGRRASMRHIVQSIVEPSAVITEGFSQLTVVTNEGQVFSGVLLEESGFTLSLGQSNGERVDIPKASIDERRTSHVSAMPEMAENLTSQQIADLATFLLSMQTPPAVTDRNTTSASSGSALPAGNFRVEEQKDRLRISLSEKPIVDFVFRDEKILRPYFANARLTDERQITRNHPPLKDVDAMDHDTMHPGIWLGFGDISGQDFWRNKATMEHVRFVVAPSNADGLLRFATECRLKSSQDEPFCLLTNHFTLSARPNGWMLVWSAEFRADQQAIVFGDQEEMGFGARVATSLTEKNGGRIVSSSGRTSAKETWGQPAKWCDYFGNDPQSGGMMLMASDRNFRECWWHNRDYGVFVANPFGREAMKQGARSAITLAPGETLKVTFGALVHDQREFDRNEEYRQFQRLMTK
ncbi:MAG: PVC-type heme-binding CxxCH protein [Planctomycetota bacterium]